MLFNYIFGEMGEGFQKLQSITSLFFPREKYLSELRQFMRDKFTLLGLIVNLLITTSFLSYLAVHVEAQDKSLVVGSTLRWTPCTGQF